jgi:Arc/MetJ family transcription regulator
MCLIVSSIHIGEWQMRINVVIDDNLMQSAIKASGLKTKKETIEEGLKLLVQLLG